MKTFKIFEFNSLAEAKAFIRGLILGKEISFQEEYCKITQRMGVTFVELLEEDAIFSKPPTS